MPVVNCWPRVQFRWHESWYFASFAMRSSCWIWPINVKSFFANALFLIVCSAVSVTHFKSTSLVLLPRGYRLSLWQNIHSFAGNNGPLTACAVFFCDDLVLVLVAVDSWHVPFSSRRKTFVKFLKHQRWLSWIEESKTIGILQHMSSNRAPCQVWDCRISTVRRKATNWSSDKGLTSNSEQWS